MAPRARAPVRQSALVAAVHADLARWQIAETTALAASALDLAARLGEKDLRPAAASMLHAQLRATLTDLAKLAVPQAAAGDPVDELQARRSERRQGA